MLVKGRKWDSLVQGQDVSVSRMKELGLLGVFVGVVTSEWHDLALAERELSH